MLANMLEMPYDVSRFANLAGRAHPSHRVPLLMSANASWGEWFPLRCRCLSEISGARYITRTKNHTTPPPTGERISQKTTKNQTKNRYFGNQVTAETNFRPEIQPSSASLLKKVLYMPSALSQALSPLPSFRTGM